LLGLRVPKFGWPSQPCPPNAHFRTPLGLPTSANNNKYVALRGEITGGGGNYVSIAESFFAEVLVPKFRSATDISTAFASAAATQLDSSMIGDPGVTDVATRRAMWVPPAYIPQLFTLLASGPITPRILWTLAETVLADPLQAVSCLPFVDWCRAVAAGGLDRANPLQMTNGANATAPVGLWLDLALGNCRGTMLASDFPTSALPAQAAQPFVNAIGNWQAESAEREDRCVAQRELELVQKSLPSRRWLHAVRRLLNVCLLDDETLLPPVWSALCHAGVKLDRSTLATLSDAPCPEATLVLQPFAEPTISVEVAKDAGHLKFLEGHDSIGGCLSIFAFCFPNQACISSTNDASSLFDQQSAGGSAPTLAEATKLKASQAIKLPDSWTQARRIFCAYHRWVQILLGELHALPLAFHAMVMELDAMSVTLEERFTAGLFQSIHLQTYRWVAQQQVSSTTIPGPNYKAVSESLDLGEWFAPALSPHTERLLPALARPPAHPSLALLLTVAPKAEPTPTRTVVDLPVSNHATGIYDIALTLGPIINLGAKSIPSNNTGQQFCLNYHVKGSCHSACIRQVDHRTHSAAESNTLRTFLAERSATVAAAGPL
jgi:hypothetical protein